MLDQAEGGCPEDYEAIFHRMWNGTNPFCMTKTTSQKSGAIRLVEKTEDEECYGELIDSIAPINMTVISGKITCAKRGGPTFI